MEEIVLTFFDAAIMMAAVGTLGLIHVYQGLTDDDRRQRRANGARSIGWFAFAAAFGIVAFGNLDNMSQRALLRFTSALAVLGEIGYYLPVLCEIVARAIGKVHAGRDTYSNNC